MCACVCVCVCSYIEYYASSGRYIFSFFGWDCRLEIANSNLIF